MKKFLKILLWCLIGFALIQLIPIDKTNPPTDEKTDFITMKNPPEKVKFILKNACYDCHSFKTVYPKYASIAPISWSIKHHVNEGRENLNFSTWGNYNDFQKSHILEHAITEVRDLKMPLPAYINYHDKARLSKEDRELLATYFETLLKTE